MTLAAQTSSKDRWEVLTWRFTVFIDSLSTSISGEEEFLRYFGREHVEKTENRADSTILFAVSDQVMRSQLEISPGKIDFAIHAAISFKPSEECTVTFSKIHDGSAIYEEFLASALNFVEERSGISRIGIGAENVFLVKSHEEGYAALAEKMLDVKLDGTNSCDFLYQINRPREITIGDKPVRINRLVKFLCKKLGVAIETNSGENNEMNVYFASVSSDVNTDYRFRVEGLSPNERREITEKLFDYSIEIGLEGETK